jgi:hypothetical protein
MNICKMFPEGLENRALSICQALAPWLLALGLVCWSGCKKDNAPTEPVETRTQILTSTSWKVQKATSPGPVDVTAQLPIGGVSFRTDGTYNMAMNQGTWEFTSNETQILFDKGRSTQILADIITLTTSELLLRFNSATMGLPVPLDVRFAPFPPADQSPVANFEALWSEFNDRYSFFELKNINWDSLHVVYKARVSSTTSGTELFGIISSMLENLRDGHVNLSTPFGRYNYLTGHSIYHVNFLGTAAINRYTVSSLVPYAGGAMYFGRIGSDIGYLYIGPTLFGDQLAWEKAIDAVIDSCSSLQRMVVDIRGNMGGNDLLASAVASRFADGEHIFSYVRWKNGPVRGAFTAPQATVIQMAGAAQFRGRVALLTNRQVFSSAEEFVLMMRVLPSVTVIGDRTGGGSGNPIVLLLPNTWQYSVSRWIQYTPAMETFEEVGLSPAIPAEISPADSINGRDAVLEKAIDYLRTGGS